MTRSLMRAPGPTGMRDQCHPLKAPAPLRTEHRVAPAKSPVTVTCPRPLHAIVRDIERLAVTVSDPDPVPVTGPRTTARLSGSGGIGSKAGGCAGPPQGATSKPVAATVRMVPDLTCREYQADRLVVNAGAANRGLSAERTVGPARQDVT